MDFTLREDETATFVLQEIEPGAGCGVPVSEPEAEELFQQTVEYRREPSCRPVVTARFATCSARLSRLRIDYPGA